LPYSRIVEAMRTRSATYEELQFTSQIPSRESAFFLREAAMFAEAFARMLPIVFGPLIIQKWTVDGAWAEASRNWGLVCSAYTTGVVLGTVFGKFSLRRRMRISQLQTPLLDSHLVRAAKNVADEAGASFLVIGLIGLALSILAIGGSRSVLVLGSARAASGFFAGALVARWDPKLMERPQASIDPGIEAGSDHGGSQNPSPKRRRGSRGERSQSGSRDPPVCAQANSATWLTGFTFGPLLGIFFQQRAFSRWKATLKLPSRVKALPEKTRQLFPALAPCIGGAIVLAALALFVMCETGIRLLKCDRGSRCHRCCRGNQNSSSNSCSSPPAAKTNDVAPSSPSLPWRCLSSLLSSFTSIAVCLICLPCSVCRCSACRTDSAQDDDKRDQRSFESEACGGEVSPLLLINDGEESEYDSDEELERSRRFMTANDCEFSDDSEHASMLSRSSHGKSAPLRERLPTTELNLDYATRSAAAMSPEKARSPSTESKTEDDPKWPDFVAAFGLSKAPAKYETMLAWRRSAGIDDIMKTQHPKFFVFKKAYPFFVHGRSKTGEIVSYENPGKMNLSQARNDGCTPQALRGILSCIYEYVTQLEREHQESLEEGDANRQARMISVVDVKGLSIGNLNKDTFAFMLTAGDIMDNYYPERVKRILIVNAPFWFTGAWKGVSALLPKTITDKVQISGLGQTMAQLLKFIEPGELPLEYIEGTAPPTTSCLALGQHPQELRLCDIVRNTLGSDDKDGARQQPPLPPPPPPPPSSSSSSSPSSRPPPLALSRSQSHQPTDRPMGSPSSSALLSSSSSSPSLVTSLATRRTLSSPDLTDLQDQQPPPIDESWNPFSRLFRPQSKHAHLGGDNKFIYDRMKGEWVLHHTSTVSGCNDGNGVSSTSSDGHVANDGTMTSESAVRMLSLDEQGGFEELLEQHAITLAIQAAHLAAEWQRVGHLPEARNSETSGGGPPLSLLHGRDQPHRKAPSGNQRRLVVLLLVLHISWCFVHLTLETVVPLWMFSHPSRGGLGFEPVDAALVFGFVGCVMLMLKSFTPRRLSTLPLHAPLRALRVAVGILVVLSLCASWVPAAELHKPRNESVIVWILVTVLLSGMAAAVNVGRSATSVMIRVAVGSEQLSPEYKKLVERSETVAEAVTPLIGGLVFAWSFDQQMPFPMDASFCFNALSVLGIGLYTCSLVLHINVVGDFGAMSEGTALNLRGGLCGQCTVGAACLEEILVLPANDVSTLIKDTKQELGLSVVAHPGVSSSSFPHPLSLQSLNSLAAAPSSMKMSSADTHQTSSPSIPESNTSGSPSSPKSGMLRGSSRGQQRPRKSVESAKDN